jgi:hypothetical protein
MSCDLRNGKQRQRAESNGTGDGRRHPGGITEGHFSNDNRAGGGFGETSNFGPSLFKTGPVDPLLVPPGSVRAFQRFIPAVLLRAWGLSILVTVGFITQIGKLPSHHKMFLCRVLRSHQKFNPWEGRIYL